MVHKHDATRLHYDLRLEMDGILASWAVPKGPSHDPGLKRLAVQTEDHPLEYGGFEGRIPDGQYGAGDSIIWDRGTYESVPPGEASAQRQRGRMLIELQGEKLKGRWHLIRTHRPDAQKDPWLLFKAKDGTEKAAFDVVGERPESVQSGRRVTRGPVLRKTLEAPHPSAEALMAKVWPPMNATLSAPDQAPASEFSYEVKYDGYRGLAALSVGQVRFQTRNALDLSSRFPEIAKALSRLIVGEAVIDGEVVAVDRAGVSHFQGLMDTGADQRFVAFDLLWLEGEDLRQRPVEERRELLHSLFENQPLPLAVAEVVDAKTVDEAMKSVRRRRLEGLVAKRKGSRYAGGRSMQWLKLKVSTSQELVIVGYTPISNGKSQIGALLVGVYEKNHLRYSGKVGTGYSQELRKKLFTLLQAAPVEVPSVEDAPRSRDAVWVKPQWVAQVAFTEWTEGGKLRHPSFVGLRMDKKPEDCIREIPATTHGRRHAPDNAKAARRLRKPR